MDFNEMGKALATATADLHIESADGLPLYAYTDPKTKKAGMSTDPKDLEARGIEHRPVVFHMVGQDSKQFRKRQSEVFGMLQRRKKMKFNEAEEERVKTVAAAIVGWDGVVMNGEFAAFSEDNLYDLLQIYAPAKEQADAWIADRGNFLKSA